MFARPVARQLSAPRGLVGRHLLGPLWNRWNVRLNDVALAALELQPQDRVLEVGFGGGYLLKRIASRVTRGEVVGVDDSPDILHSCAHYLGAVRTRVDLRQAPASALPCPDKHFDKACSVNSLFYWPEPDKGVRELARVLAPEGKLVLVLTSKRSLEKRWFARDTIRVPEIEELEAMLERAGFVSVKVIRDADWLREFSCFTALRGPETSTAA